MDPSVLKQIVLGTLPPGLMGLVVVALWWWSGLGARSVRGLALGAGLLGVAFVPISALVLGGLAFPPASASQWVPWFGLIAGFGAFVVARWGVSCALGWLARVSVIAAVGWLSVRGQARGEWGAGQTVAALAGFAGITLTVLWACDRSLAGGMVVVGGGIVPRFSLVPSLVVMVMLGGIAQVLVLGFFSLALGLAAGVAAALIGGVFVGSLWKRRVPVRPGVFDAPIVLGIVMLFHGYLFGDSEHPWLFVGLIVASPVAAAVARRVLPLEWQTWGRGAIEVAAAIVPAAVAVGFALAQHPQE